MSEDKVLELILEKAGTRDDGRRTLRCRDAFAIASENKGVSVGAVGRVCTKNDVKIKSCQLGCFK